jgi:hypothetical protein
MLRRSVVPEEKKMDQYVVATKRSQAIFGIPFGGLFVGIGVYVLLEAFYWSPAKYSGPEMVLVVAMALLGLFGLLVMIPQSIRMMISPRTFMIADSDGITLHHYGGSTTIDRDDSGKIYIERKRGRTITIPWNHVLSFSKDRSTLGKTSMPGRPAAKSQCLHITIDPSVNLDRFTTKGLIATDSAFDTSTLSPSAYARRSAEELERDKYAFCCILGRFLPEGIDHAIQILEGMKCKYARG